MIHSSIGIKKLINIALNSLFEVFVVGKNKRKRIEKLKKVVENKKLFICISKPIPSSDYNCLFGILLDRFLFLRTVT